VPVYPGDVIVADEDGAIVVPRHLADEVARDSFEQERLEKFVAIRVGQGRPIPGTYPPDDETKALYQASIKAGEPPNG
jgi:regulator of RNase E activity RraA